MVESKKKKILLIGPMPPPSGGVSVHLDRMLNDGNGTDFILAAFDIRKGKIYFQNHSGGNWFALIKFFFSSRIIHIHISHSVKVFIALLSRLLGKTVIYTQHNPRELKNISTKWVIRLSNKVIYVFHPEGIPEKGVVIPAYIPSNDYRPLPADLGTELEQYEKVIVSSGSGAGVKENERDLYGFDIILDALGRLNDLKQVLLVLTNSDEKTGTHYSKWVEDLEARKGLKVFFAGSDINFSRLMMKSHVFIRATRSDGDSLSVREALQAGTTVLASDSVSRPPGCRIFHSEDPKDLSDKLIEVLDNPKRIVFDQENFAEMIFQLYNKI